MSGLSDLFSYSDQSVLLLGTYSTELVVLSLLVAIFSSFCAFAFATQTRYRNTTGIYRKLTLLGGSVVLGCGIWAMHFIGMLAFSLCTEIRYQAGMTLVSMLPSIMASWVVLNILVEKELATTRLLQGGLLMGAGIGVMHYTGMGAMQMAPILKYDPLYFGLSILVAVVLATLALWFRFGLLRFSRRHFSDASLNGISGVVMGCAIACMHYMGMAAARFVQPEGGLVLDKTIAPSETLAIGIAAITVVITLLVLGINMLLMYQSISIKARRNEERLRTTMETALDGILTINGAGEIVSANKAVSAILGWQPEELQGRLMQSLLPEPYSTDYERDIKQYQSSGDARMIGQGWRITALHKDGSEVPVRLGIGHTLLEGEDLFVAFMADISQHLKMEQEIQASEAKLRSLIGNIPGAAFRCLSVSPWPMFYISDAVYEITGYEAEDFLLPDPKVTFADIIHPDDVEWLVFPSVHRQSYSFEYRIITKNGEVRWVLDHGVYLEDEASAGKGWLDGFVMDITEHKELVAALQLSKTQAEQASAAKSAFLANMSHEIRTPMNAIIGFSDVLMQSGLSFEQQRHALTINNSAKSLLHLLNDILDSAKLEKGKLELELKDFSLSEQVDMVISTLWVQARKKQLALDLDIDPTLEEFYFGAPDRIRQVLINLVGNAVKFTETGRVSVRLSRQPGAIGDDSTQVLFEVEDTGIGIAADRLDSIFEPFTQADASMSRRFGGTGLGTTISKQLVELMGGSIAISSELGKGTLISFVLPLKPGQKPQALALDAAVGLPKLQVLVADDIVQNRDLLRLMFERKGHEVTLAVDGQDALDVFRDGRFDVVLMDVQMPTMDGLEAARQIRLLEAIEARLPTPIVALTASVLEEDKQASQAAGMDGFASKPVDFGALCHEIARVLGLVPDAPLLAAGIVRNDLAMAVNLQKGIELWGDQSVYLLELDGFLSKLQDSLETLRSLAAAGDLTALSQRAHALKGVCGNLALPELMKVFSQLEIVAGKADLARSGLLLDELPPLFAEVIEFVRVNKVEAITASDQSSYLDDTQLLAMVEQLISAANHGELDEALMVQLAVGCRREWVPQVGAIKSAFDDFDFEVALRHLKHLQAELGGIDDLE